PAPAAALARPLASGVRAEATPRHAAEAAARRALAARQSERLGLALADRGVRILGHADLRGESRRRAVSLLPAVLAHRPGDALHVRRGRRGLPVVVVHVHPVAP